MKYIKKVFRNWIGEIVRENVLFGWGEIEKEINHSLFSYIGVERLKKMLEDIEKQDNKYVNLAELYSFTLRNNLQKENSEIVHNYYELLPRLAEYKRSLDKPIKED